MARGVKVVVGEIEVSMDSTNMAATDRMPVNRKKVLERQRNFSLIVFESVCELSLVGREEETDVNRAYLRWRKSRL